MAVVGRWLGGKVGAVGESVVRVRGGWKVRFRRLGFQKEKEREVG